jgi:N-acetylglucosaminyl-diphospho-decaprenol L-rhamnosyltransferase
MDAQTPTADVRPVSVWLVNYNSAEYLRTCLAGLTSPRIGSIVVLDNASRPADRALVQELAAGDPRVQLLLSEVNVGFGGGHQLIADATRGQTPAEPIWILNPDTAVGDEAVAALAAVIASDAADVVAPLILTGRGAAAQVWFAGGRIDRRRASVRPAYTGAPLSAVPRSPLFPTEFITGASMMMTRGTWDRLGGLRADLFLYWEDVDLSLRAAAAGLRLAVAGDATIWHAEGGSAGAQTRTSAATYYYTARNRILVCADGHPVGLVAGRGSAYALRLAARAFLVGGRGRWDRLSCVLAGSVAGLRGRTGPR